MASEVKAWSLPVEDFRLRLSVTTGTLDLCLSTTPHSFESRLQHPGCTKHVIKVPVRGSPRRGPRLPGVAPGAFETHTFLPSALQNHQLTLRKAGSFVTRLDARAASGLGRRSDPQPKSPRRAGGQSKRVRSGTLAYGYLPGSTSQTQRLSQYPWLRSSQVGLRSAYSSPARSAWLRHGSGMVRS